MSRTLVLALAAFATLPAFAQKAGGGSGDGTVSISQSSALAGAVTPGDAAGFPVTLSKPGYYRLVSNLTAPAGAHAIEVTADDVTIDLGGFTLQGAGNCTFTVNTPSSIVCQGANSANGVQSQMLMTRVSNGHVKGFHKGVALGYGGHIDALQISHVESSAASTYSGIISNTVVRISGGYGLGGAGVIRDNVVWMTRYQGISGAKDSLIANNQVAYADSFGINANASGAGGVAFNVVSNTTFAPINGGVRIGGNVCNGVACP